MKKTIWDIRAKAEIAEVDEDKIIFAFGNDPEDCDPNPPKFLKKMFDRQREQRKFMLAYGLHILRNMDKKR